MANVTQITNINGGQLPEIGIKQIQRKGGDAEGKILAQHLVKMKIILTRHSMKHPQKNKDNMVMINVLLTGDDTDDSQIAKIPRLQTVGVQGHMI